MIHIDKKEIIKEYQQHAQDTGSIEVQIVSLTERINQLNGHLSKYPHDFSSKHGLIKLVGQRRSFLAYLQRTNAAMYKKLIDRLGLRR
jgi:small subunit ribosomal protein S15